MAETDGYWGEGFFAGGYWGEGFWGEYSLPATGGDSARYYYYDRLPKKDNKELFETLKILLESIRGN